MHARLGRLLSLLAVVCGVCTTVDGQDQLPPTKIRTIRVTEHVYMLSGAGGNLGLSIGEDGAMLIDSEYGELTGKVLAATKEIADRPVRFVVNTHWHFDHVGGNENLAKAGAVVVAQENVRRRMGEDRVLGGLGRRIPPSPAAALPVITYPEAMTFHVNGDDVQIIHLDPAHTDGDSLVLFTKANVLHTGDVYFNGVYPYIDVNAGGSIDGMIKAVDRVLTLTNEKTKIIPGHGPLSGADELRAYRRMLVTCRDRVQALIKQGKSRAEAIAAKPTKDLDKVWGRGGMTPEEWVGIVYDALMRKS